MAFTFEQWGWIFEKQNYREKKRGNMEGLRGKTLELIKKEVTIIMC